MHYSPHTSATVFAGHRRLASGVLHEVVLAAKAAADTGDAVLVFNDASGHLIELDLRGSEQDVVQRLAAAAHPAPNLADISSRGRPHLGVVSRDVTLLPRHWEWLAAQPGGASATLRRLVEQARRASGGEQRREAQESSYRVMSTLAGHLPGFEEAARALFACDAARFADQVAGWPEDVRSYVSRLAMPGFARELASRNLGA